MFVSKVYLNRLRCNP